MRCRTPLTRRTFSISISPHIPCKETQQIPSFAPTLTRKKCSPSVQFLQAAEHNEWKNSPQVHRELVVVNYLLTESGIYWREYKKNHSNHFEPVYTSTSERGRSSGERKREREGERASVNEKAPGGKISWKVKPRWGEKDTQRSLPNTEVTPILGYVPWQSGEHKRRSYRQTFTTENFTRFGLILHQQPDDKAQMRSLCFYRNPK